MPYPGIPEEALETVGSPAPDAVAALRDALRPHADPPEAALRTLLDFGRLLLAANQRVRLTGARDWEALVGPHLLDSLSAAARVPADLRRFLDWGAGGGLPGLVWAAARPDWRLVLSERNRKKAAFLDDAAARLDLANVEVRPVQAQEAWPRLQPRPDAVVARAVEPLDRLLPKVSRLNPPPRALLVFGGPSWREAWGRCDAPTRDAWTLAAVDDYEPGAGLGARSLLRFTPNRLRRGRGSAGAPPSAPVRNDSPEAAP